ncbi:hypothetical protein MD484_g652, partial [Candolleomyces efflorescens]
MGTFNVSQQAFLHVETYNTPGLEELGINGLLGLGFDLVRASPINLAVMQRDGRNATWGSSVLRNILSQDDLDANNFIALDLARGDDLEDVVGGSFSIGEYAEPWSAVAQAPKLYQYPRGGYRWSTLLEGITVGGTALNLSSALRDVPPGRLVTLLDTGDASAVLPQHLRNEVYSYIPGAVTFTQDGEQTSIIPCNTTTIVEFSFGGQRIPIHPLDLSYLSAPIMAGGQNYTACISSILGEELASQGFEVSLGDVFLRNVYSVFDFGDPNGTVAGQPYMQLLSQTDPANATAQVVPIRNRTMAGLPPEIEPAKLLEMLRAEDPTIHITTSSTVTLSMTSL